ncbi:MAG: flagellar basal body L-ring protein FlgH [Thermaurantiacus tibetensis]|uniref:flagellar basal body L-ring protein FlgH n=1 Tax=Thermaurantiacus tibetensis TaxID=2759035 RepID=UPI00188EE1A6|nr:flagellar basal body L-ring protein FlgH [Thermaurantiacus tibetensis]
MLLVLLGACKADRFREQVAYIPPAPPAPQPPPEARAATGSIWAGAVHRAGLGTDRKAARVGDLLTILLVERTVAEKAAAQTAQRQSQRAIDISGLPVTDAAERALSGGSDTSFNGRGATQQSNRLSGEFTVTVTDVLPNGTLRVAGDRRLLLTRGEEQVQLTGLVRPEDIGPDNRVPSTRVADARIRYSGTGEVAAQARQGWFARFFDRITPY